MNNPKNMGALFDQLEADLIAQYKATPPEQLAAEEQRRKIKREYEAKHTPIETDEDRANTEEYPQDEDEE
jgi:hypothetical protein